MAELKPGRGTGDNDRLIARALREARRPMSAYELIEQLRDDGINAPTTVYRALNRLIDSGQVHRLESLNAFVCCAGDCQHGTAVFAICGRCGAVVEFSDMIVTERLASWARATGFNLDHATIELSGRCQSCVQNAPGDST
ncbi:MAG: Fur family transcriptional regulator [Hyphomicrobiaceae bacterium]